MTMNEKTLDYLNSSSENIENSNSENIENSLEDYLINYFCEIVRELLPQYTKNIDIKVLGEFYFKKLMQNIKNYKDEYGIGIDSVSNKEYCINFNDEYLKEKIVSEYKKKTINTPQQSVKENKKQNMSDFIDSNTVDFGIDLTELMEIENIKDEKYDGLSTPMSNSFYDDTYNRQKITQLPNETNETKSNESEVQIDDDITAMIRDSSELTDTTYEKEPNISFELDY